MSMQWQYGDKCSRCKGPLGAKRCKGMCNACYYKNRRETDPRFAKEARRVDSPKKDWTGASYLGLTPSLADWARLAAFIDGEGNINLNPRRTKDSPIFCARVQVCNTDVRLALWLEKTFGMKFYANRVENEKWKTCYWSQAHGYRACWLLHNCMSLFIFKGEQAALVLEHQATMNSFERRSGLPTPQNVVEFRAELKRKLQDLTRRGPKMTVGESAVNS